ncbi:hypothetical protein CAI21_13820 [Alkalilimnicola ehrlichii]|uniref:Uncharacterized protein n=1 Tax=Alkalilimnicola ehrlichii TaxID=351052 RepID=A0A3E0WR61_9GAMM|nr:hypothetical protein [Alkalilimnicola ehrlichii]RFA27990.1 hypothetical protein CAI21_13820 [Alkalilimnicola ehrlichii]RFA34641.1 hypothetical protein CAL65_14860 [Alkalilimnicola ehrlichii]
MHRSGYFKLAMILGPALLSLGAVAWVGEGKTWRTWDWLDIVGEGGAAALTLAWIVCVLASRPGGRVTNLLVIGFAGIFLSLWQDLLDEFFISPRGGMRGWKTYRCLLAWWC